MKADPDAHDDLQAARDAWDEATAWITAHAADAVLAQQWPRWEALLGRLASLLEERPARLVEREGLKDELATAEATLTKHTALAEDAARHLSAAEEQSLEAEQGAAQAFGGRDLSAAREELDDRRVTVAELRAIRQRASEAKSALERAEREETSAREEIDAATATERESQERSLSLQAVLEEAECATRDARLALGLEDRRHDLRDDHPCPLCGATEHPYAGKVPAFSGFLRKRERRTSELRGELDREREIAERARVRAHHAKARTLAARAKAVSSKEERDLATEPWFDLGFKLGWKLGQNLPQPWEPEAVETLSWLEDGTRQQLVVVRRLQDELDRGRQGLAAARQECALAERRQAASDKVAESVRHRWNLLEQALMSEGELERRLNTELSEACERQGWREALRADPGAFLDDCRSAQERYHEHEERERELRAAVVAAEAALLDIRANRRADDAVLNRSKPRKAELEAQRARGEIAARATSSRGRSKEPRPERT